MSGIDRQVESETKRTLDRFKAAVDLGVVAARMEQQSKRILAAIEQMLPYDDVVAEEGVEFLIRPSDRRSQLTCEALIEGSESEQWEKVFLHDVPYLETIDHDEMSVPSFFGKIIRRHGNDPLNLWVYNDAENFRVLFEEGLELTTVDTRFHEANPWR